MVTEFERYNWKTFVILWCKRVFFLNVTQSIDVIEKKRLIYGQKKKEWQKMHS